MIVFAVGDVLLDLYFPAFLEQLLIVSNQRLEVG